MFECTQASLYDLIASTKLESRHQSKIGEWNHGKIVLYHDNNVQHWLNCFKVVEYVRGSNVFKKLVAGTKYAKNENFGLGENGPVLLQPKLAP